MKHKKISMLAIGACILFTTLHFLLLHAKSVEATVPVPSVEAIEEESIILTHRQEVWIHVLEWCESKGYSTAINKVDRDGTPSYYSFQFKPSTFKGYAIRYEILPIDQIDTYAELMDELEKYENQRAIVEHMIFDSKVRWENEFPDCVMKNGRPPKD